MKKVEISQEDQVLVRIMNVMETKGVRQKDLADYLGLSMPSLTQWKTRRTHSYMKHIDRIADFLEVDKDFLLYGDSKKSNYDYSLTSVEFDIVNIYRKLSDTNKKDLFNIIKTFYHAVQCTN